MHVFNGFMEKIPQKSPLVKQPLVWVVKLCNRVLWGAVGCAGRRARSRAVRAALGGSSPQELPGSGTRSPELEMGFPGP